MIDRKIIFLHTSVMDKKRSERSVFYYINLIDVMAHHE